MPPMSSQSKFEKELSVYEHHRQTWLAEDREGQFVVIKGDKFIGFYDDLGEAYAHGAKEFGESFLVREIKRTDDVLVIHRVAWSFPSRV